MFLVAGNKEILGAVQSSLDFHYITAKSFSFGKINREAIRIHVGQDLSVFLSLCIHNSPPKSSHAQYHQTTNNANNANNERGDKQENERR